MRVPDRLTLLLILSAVVRHYLDSCLAQRNANPNVPDAVRGLAVKSTPTDVKMSRGDSLRSASFDLPSPRTVSSVVLSSASPSAAPSAPLFPRVSVLPRDSALLHAMLDSAYAKPPDGLFEDAASPLPAVQFTVPLGLSDTVALLWMDHELSREWMSSEGNKQVDFDPWLLDSSKSFFVRTVRFKVRSVASLFVLSRDKHIDVYLLFCLLCIF